MSRRSDGTLRQAISTIENMLFTDPSTDAILSRCLTQLMLLLGSSYGYVYRCTDSTDETVPWELSTCFEYKNGELQELDTTSTSSCIPSIIQARLLAGRCISSENNDTSSLALPKTHPPISTYCCIPIVDAKRIYSVIYLCNCIGGNDKDFQTRLRPFIAVSSCLLRASEKKHAFQHKIQRNEDFAEHPELLLGLLDTMFNGVIVVNDNDLITLCNNAAASILSLSKSNIIGSKLSRFLPKGAPQLHSRLPVAERSSDTKNIHKATWRGIPAIKGNGEKILVDISAFELNKGNDSLRGLVMDDISERMKSTSDYHSTLQRFQVLTNLAPIGILQLNRDWECTYSNDTWCEYCQMTPEEAQNIGWLRGLHVADADTILENLRRETALSGKFEGEFRLQSPLGKVTWVKANACSLYSENGTTTGLIITFNDITTHLSNERRLRDIAERDQLTGLINRAFFNDRVDIALKGISRFGAVALMFIDLDEFKHINDTLGHAAGDQLLREMATRMQDKLREVDTIARIGGDEFTILITNVQNTRSITAIADKLVNALSDPFVLNDRPVYITCSIGIAVADQSDSEAKHFIKQADVALYKAKEAGKNQYRFYTAELERNSNIHIHLRQSLKETGRSDFKAVYQPQVDARTGNIIGLEALARWGHPDVEPIGPNIFIKMVEESGLIDDFCAWLFEEVFSTMQRWQEKNCAIKNIPVSINLSAKQFRNPDLASHVYQRCMLHGLNPKLISFEITETALIDDPTVAANTLKKLRNMGFSLALDDFGTGYSSLVYLRNMPFQCVKIDQSFTKDILIDEDDAKIVSAILALAENLELDVIAEGVDNAAVKQWLIDHNCFCHQGYYFYKPMSATELEKISPIQYCSQKVVHLESRMR